MLCARCTTRHATEPLGRSGELSTRCWATEVSSNTRTANARRKHARVPRSRAARATVLRTRSELVWRLRVLTRDTKHIRWRHANLLEVSAKHRCKLRPNGS